MNEWEIAVLVLLVALVPCLAVCALAGVVHGLAALEVAGTVTSTAFMALSEGFHRQSFIDLAVILALLSMLGALVFARLLERGL